jgi:hypothetical protein
VIEEELLVVFADKTFLKLDNYLDQGVDMVVGSVELEVNVTCFFDRFVRIPDVCCNMKRRFF